MLNAIGRFVSSPNENKNSSIDQKKPSAQITRNLLYESMDKPTLSKAPKSQENRKKGVFMKQATIGGIPLSNTVIARARQNFIAAAELMEPQVMSDPQFANCTQSLVQVLSLTQYQQRMMTQTWPNIYATGSVSIGSTIVNAMCGASANARYLFNEFNTSVVLGQNRPRVRVEHSKYILDMIDYVVKSINNPVNATASMLFDLGAKHQHLRQHGLKSAIWDDLSDALLSFVRRNEQVRKHKELGRAYAVLISFICTRLKDGHYALSDRSRNNSTCDINQPLLQQQMTSQKSLFLTVPTVLQAKRSLSPQNSMQMQRSSEIQNVKSNYWRQSSCDQTKRSKSASTGNNNVELEQLKLECQTTKSNDCDSGQKLNMESNRINVIDPTTNQIESLTIGQYVDRANQMPKKSSYFDFDDKFLPNQLTTDV